MIFYKLETINPRNEIKNYFNNIVKFPKYSINFGIIQEYFSILLLPYTLLNDTLVIDINNCESFELSTNEFYLKFPVTIEFIDTPIDIRDKYQYFTEANMQKLIGQGYSIPFHSLEEGVKDYVENYLVPNKYM